MTQEEFLDRYEYAPSKDRLGSGGFGTVYKAYDTLRKREVAIKVAPVRPDKFSLMREAQLVKELKSHENLARYENCYRFKNMREQMDYAIMAYYPAGNLQDVLNKQTLTELEKQTLLKGILKGIAHLHQEGVIHRDLKGENILIEKKNEQLIPNISDLGLSRFASTSENSITNSSVGISFAYAAPEQIKGTKIKKNVDLWAYGVLAYLVMTNELPFQTDSQSPDSKGVQIELGGKITSGELPDKLNQIPTPYQTIIRRCLVVDTEKRVQTAEELLALFPKESADTSPNLDSGKTILVDNTSNDSPKKKANWLMPLFAVLGVFLGLVLIYNFVSFPKASEAPKASISKNAPNKVSYEAEKQRINTVLKSILENPKAVKLQAAFKAEFSPNANLFSAKPNSGTQFKQSINELLLSLTAGKTESVRVDSFATTADQKISYLSYFEKVIVPKKASIKAPPKKTRTIPNKVKKDKPKKQATTVPTTPTAAIKASKKIDYTQIITQKPWTGESFSNGDKSKTLATMYFGKDATYSIALIGEEEQMETVKETTGTWTLNDSTLVLLIKNISFKINRAGSSTNLELEKVKVKRALLSLEKLLKGRQDMLDNYCQEDSLSKLGKAECDGYRQEVIKLNEKKANFQLLIEEIDMSIKNLEDSKNTYIYLKIKVKNKKLHLENRTGDISYILQ